MERTPGWERPARQRGTARAAVAVVAVMLALGSPVSAQFDLPRDLGPPSTWRPRARILPTLTTTHRGIESGGGFGLELGAERPFAGERVAPWIGLVVASDDRKALGCLACDQGRMSAYLVATGVTLRAAPSWRVSPLLEAWGGAGGVTWSLGAVNVPVGVGFVGGGRTGGSGTWRGSAGAGFEVRWGDRVVSAGVSRALVWEQRWDAPRAVTTIALGVRALR